MRKQLESLTIGNQIDFALTELFDLQDEMQSAAENMPEQLSGAHAQAATSLELAWSGLSDCGVPDDLSEEEVTWTKWVGKIHRPQRRDNVVSYLCAYLARVPKNDNTEKLRADLEYIIDTLRGVFFPGMSGRRAA